MKLRTNLVLVIITISASLFSVSQFGCSFLFINTSARDAAFGLESGTAGLRFLSPSSIDNNPAKLGAYIGIGYEFSAYDYTLGEFTASAIAFGWDGIGIRFPFLNSETKFGTTMMHGKQTISDENGNIIDEFNPYENNSKISFGVDILKWSNQYLKNTDVENYQKFMKLYLGYSYNSVNSQLAPDTDYIKLNGKSSFGEIGFLFQYFPAKFKSQYSNWDLTCGVNFVNPTKAEIYYISEEQADPLPYGIKLGFSGCYSLDLEWLSNKNPQSNNSLLPKFTDKALVIYASYDRANYGGIREISGYGCEVSLLNIFSYRIGYTDNFETGCNGFSYSFGCNIKYRKKVGIAIDYTRMFDSSEIYSPKKLNLIANYNF